MKSMKSTFPAKIASAVLTACAVFCASAQEAAESNEGDSASAPAAEGEGAAAAKPESAPAGKDFRFAPLYSFSEARCGTVEILLPGSSAWLSAVKGRFYPYGSKVRLVGDGTGDAFARFMVGPKAFITLSGNSMFETREIKIGEKARTVVPVDGVVGLDMPRSLKDGLLTVSTPDFVCSNIAGESRFESSLNPDAREVVVRVVTGSLSLEGVHYRIPRMGAANQVRICTSKDKLLTSLRGESGDYKVLLDCGVKSVLDPETGANKDVPQSIEYGLSPQCAVKIWRKVSRKEEGGSGRMAVAVQTFDAQGKDKNFRAFFEARANVNSGELIVPPKDTAKEEAEKSKSAAEDVEEVSADTAADGASSASGDAGSAGNAAPAADSSGDGL